MGISNRTYEGLVKEVEELKIALKLCATELWRSNDSKTPEGYYNKFLKEGKEIYEEEGNFMSEAERIERI